MDNEMFGDLIQSLNQALDYAKGDKSKARSVFIEIADNELEQRQLFWQKFESLSEPNRLRVEGYIDRLLQAESA